MSNIFLLLLLNQIFCHLNNPNLLFFLRVEIFKKNWRNKMAAFVSFERSARGKTVKSFVFLFLFPSVIEGVGLGIVLLNSSFFFFYFFIY